MKITYPKVQRNLKINKGEVKKVTFLLSKRQKYVLLWHDFAYKYFLGSQ